MEGQHESPGDPRHPVSRYRFYMPKELDALLGQVDELKTTHEGTRGEPHEL